MFALSLFALAPAAARAQDARAQAALDAEARSLFEAGRSAFEAGRFEAALARFREAYELSGRPTLLYNVGTAADRLRRDAEALEAFRAYVAALPDAPNRAEVESRIRVLEGAVAEDRERGAPGPTVDADPEPAVELTAPAQETASAQPATTFRAEPRDDRDAGGGGSIADEWWFWTILGVVVIGAGVGIGAGVALSDSSSTQAPLPGTMGVVVVALEGL
ncbi:MAG: tetratricopeptide repeat protein [Myxococcota bacterium]|nr:tetratricopeptide repeat protein [Myxococcota bacterium]